MDGIAERPVTAESCDLSWLPGAKTRHCTSVRGGGKDSNSNTAKVTLYSALKSIRWACLTKSACLNTPSATCPWNDTLSSCVSTIRTVKRCQLAGQSQAPSNPSPDGNYPKFSKRGFRFRNPPECQCNTNASLFGGCSPDHLQGYGWL